MFLKPSAAMSDAKGVFHFALTLLSFDNFSYSSRESDFAVQGSWRKCVQAEGDPTFASSLLLSGCWPHLNAKNKCSSALKRCQVFFSQTSQGDAAWSWTRTSK